MNELKTLKDLEWIYPRDLAKEDTMVSIHDLKQEAIKWVKWIGDADKPHKENNVTINFIKHFFNITEDDLK